MRQKSKWKDQEFINIYKRKWYNKNKDKGRKYQEEYYKRNKVKIGKKRKINRQKPEEKLKQKIRIKKWRQKNKEKIKAYKKKYQQENREKIKIYRQTPKVKKREKELYQKNKKGINARKRKNYQKLEVKAKHRIYRQIPHVKKRIKEYNKKYGKQYRQRSKVKEKTNKRIKQRMKNDPKFYLTRRLQDNFRRAFKHYSKTGKTMSSKKYGIDYKKIIKHLGPKPKDGRIYEIDHIIPLSLWDFDNSKHIKKVFAPENHQWLTKEINIWKGNRLIKPLTDKQKERLQKQIEKGVKK